MANHLVLVVDDEELGTNAFVEGILRDIMLAILKNLRGTEHISNITKIEISS